MNVQGLICLEICVSVNAQCCFCLFVICILKAQNEEVALEKYFCQALIALLRLHVINFAGCVVDQV